ncbi:MAG: flagellar assembly protein FliW [Candidatus Marinimicrobia bacterium]|nr:flagellar assembly protein FliW [Candidatus Neomarinimicrobiota bacterium]
MENESMMQQPNSSPQTPKPEKGPQFRIDAEQGIAIEFPGGIPGFEELHHYHLFELLDYPHFAFLVADDASHVAMLLLDPKVISQKIEVTVPPEKLTQISLSQEEKICTFFILRLNHSLGKLTANLRAPIIVSTEQKTGYQVILDDESLPISYPLVPDTSSASAPTSTPGQENSFTTIKQATRTSNGER